MPKRTSGERYAAKLDAEVAAYEPERPPCAWTCPECGRTLEAGIFYCAHEDCEDVMSHDMRPRIRKYP